MGDDYFNPFTDETYVKPLPWLEAALLWATRGAALIAGVWAITAIILSLG